MALVEKTSEEQPINSPPVEGYVESMEGFMEKLGPDYASKSDNTDKGRY